MHIVVPIHKIFLKEGFEQYYGVVDTIHVMKQNPIAFWKFYSQIEQNLTNTFKVIQVFIVDS